MGTSLINLNYKRANYFSPKQDGFKEFSVSKKFQILSAPEDLENIEEGNLFRENYSPRNQHLELIPKIVKADLPLTYNLAKNQSYKPEPTSVITAITGFRAMRSRLAFA